ncbi:hypothetical protein N8I74_11770 [Chitiniphilus purpureus]|uniref:Uncharacterized protein n=1 Tax=Chitiniphilus purpureus TaxID=2981137 RepID=A0ABY6DI28_9NEIS|nr:hypothetical protein [Chitiniphilus sp. CD1]UXY14000.1 hypothetical protein N8I74_11770 [Chitiniphilus sp. CD1]
MTFSNDVIIISIAEYYLTNMKSLSKYLEQLEQQLAPFSTFAGLLAKILPLLGTYYLFCYFLSEDAPFPLELSVLPTVILAVGLLGVVLYLILVGNLLLPNLMLTDVYRSGFALHQPNDQAQRPLPRRYLLHFVVPGLVFSAGSFVSIYQSSTSDNGFWILLMLVTLAIIALWLRLLCESGVKFWAHLSAVLSYGFLFTVGSLSLSLFVLQQFQPKTVGMALLYFVPMEIAHCAVVTLSVWPILDLARKGAAATPGEVPAGDASPETTGSAGYGRALALTAFLLATTLHPTLAAKLGQGALRALKAGGGTLASYCFKDALPKPVGDRLGTKDGHCTGQLYTVLDAGDKTIVKASQAAPVHSLDASQLIDRALRPKPPR